MIRIRLFRQDSETPIYVALRTQGSGLGALKLRPLGSPGLRLGLWRGSLPRLVKSLDDGLILAKYSKGYIGIFRQLLGRRRPVLLRVTELKDPPDEGLYTKQPFKEPLIV